MDWLQTMLDNSTTPVLTAFLLGLLTAISPCPLATNIAAIGYISKDIVDRRSAFRKGLLYALGRLAAYTILGIVLIGVIRRGASMFGIQNFIGTLGEQLLGPLLIIIGTLMLFSSKLNLPQFGFKGNGEKIAKKNGWGAFLLGCLFAMAFCPSSGMFYFGMLIPMSATASMGYLMPAVFAVATALPVLIVAWILAFSASEIGKFYGMVKSMEGWISFVVAIIFLLVGFYYSYITFI